MIRFALVVPCHDFIPNAMEIFTEHCQQDPSFNGELYQMEEVVVTNENVSHVDIQADIIITRGLYAEILKSIKEREIPVVEIPIPTLDMIRSLRADSIVKENSVVGIISTQKMLADVEELADIFGVVFKPYLLEPETDRCRIVDQALGDGCNVITGSVKSLEYARSIGVDTVPIQTSLESFWESLTMAKQAAQISRTEQETIIRLRTIINHSKEGILYIDFHKRVTLINDLAIKLLDLKEDVLEQRIEDTSMPLEFKRILVRNPEFSNELVRYKSIMLNVSKIPILVQNQAVGSVVTFQDVNSVQTLEENLRQKIYHLGHVAKANFHNITGDSPQLRSAVEKARIFAESESPILLTGESGTGKELFAQSIHNASCRKHSPFVAVNCAAIPESLVESEFFGYADGAFTGAQKKGKPGYLELAHGGTIF